MTALFFLHYVLLLVGFAALAAGVGRRLLGNLAGPDPLTRWALALPAGLGAWAALGYLLGLADLLRPLPIALAALLGLAAARPALAELWHDLARLPPAWAAGGTAAAGLLGYLALYPPTAWDATTYHLPLTRAFVDAGGYLFVPSLRMPVFPLLSETLFALAWPAGGVQAAQLVTALSTLGTALLLLAWSGHRLARPERPLAAAILLGSPIVVLYAGTAYIDPGLMLFVTAALLACDRFQRCGDLRWLLLAGGFVGCAAATKYLGLYFFCALPLAALARRGPRRFWGAALAGLAVAVAVAAPWYGRIVYWTGNPLFPFLPGVFGDSPWGTLTADLSGQIPDRFDELLARVFGLLRVPWDALFARHRLNLQPPASPMVLLVLPSLVLVTWRRRWARPWVAVTAGYALAFAALPTDLRYLLPIAPFSALAIAATAGWARQHARARGLYLGRRWGSALAVLTLLPGPLYFAYHLARQGPVPVTASDRSRYLARHLPLYPAIEHLNRSHGQDYALYTYYAERMIYFVEGRQIGERNGLAPYREIAPLLGAPADLARRLAAFGADHLLLPKRPDVADLPAGPEREASFELVFEDGAARVYALRPGAGGS